MLFLAAVFSCPQARPEEGNEKPDCDTELNACVDQYRDAWRQYKELGCSKLGRYCSGMPDPADKEFCDKMRSISTSDDLAPAKPGVYVERATSCGKVATACSPKESAGVPGFLKDTYDSGAAHCAGVNARYGPFPAGDPLKGNGTEVNLAGGKGMNKSDISGLKGGSGSGPGAGASGKPADPMKEKFKRVFFDLNFRQFISKKVDCEPMEKKVLAGVKESAAGKGVDDPHHFCARFYPEAEKIEGAKGNMPLEITNKLAEGEKAGLRLGKVKAVLEFETLEDCIREIKRLDLIYGNIIKFFEAYDKDLKVVCEAIRDGRIGELWQLKAGSGPRMIFGVKR